MYFYDKFGGNHWKYPPGFIGIPLDDFCQWSNVTLLQSSLTVTVELQICSLTDLFAGILLTLGYIDNDNIFF